MKSWFCAAYWWNPAAGLACRKLREAEEACCDAWVAWLWPQGTRDYARLLVTTLDFLAGDTSLPRGACGFASFHLLTRRFAMILDRSAPRRLSWSEKGLLVLAALPVLALSATAQPAPAEEQPPAPAAATSVAAKPAAPKPSTAEEERNRADELLLARIDCSAKDLPLRDFLNQISGGPEKCKIVLDEARLQADEGLSPTTPVTLQAQQIRRQAALRLVLEPLGASFLVADGVIHVTSHAGMEAVKIRIRRHYIADLLTSPWQSAPVDAKARVTNLRSFIESTVAPTAWSSGEYSLRLDDDPRYLQVRASESSQELIARLLEQIRATPDGSRGSEQLVKQLPKRHDFTFQDTPLKEALARIGNVYGVSIHIAPTTLEAAGIPSRTPITLQGKEMTLAEVLNRLLMPLNLYYKVDDEVIKIESDMSAPLITKTYAVFDLISPDNAEESLAALSRRIKADESWLDVGEITPFPNNLSLVVSQTERGHEAVESTLAELRKNKKPLSFFIGVKRQLRRCASQGSITLPADVGQAEVAALKAVRQLQVVQAEQVQDRGVQVVDVDRVFHRRPADLVGLAVDLAALDAAAGHQHAERIRMMVAARSRSRVPPRFSPSGVRPNSLAHTTSVSSNSPRCFRSLISAAIG